MEFDWQSTKNWQSYNRQRVAYLVLGYTVYVHYVSKTTPPFQTVSRAGVDGFLPRDAMLARYMSW